MPSHRSIVIFSGGTAANHLVDVFESVRKSKDCPLSYIIPISDNGGSSSELIRVFGGPGIGDVRSRLVRLIPRLPHGSPGSREREAIRALFNHRLSSTDARTAKLQWAEVVDGTSDLWKDISSAKKELIRSFFNLVSSEITKRSRPPRSTFDFTSASVGNLFLTGARLFSGSFESAIYLLESICGIEDEYVKVIPSINSNFSHNIAAGLEDGTVIVGQNAISHPSPDASTAPTGTEVSDEKPTLLRRSSSLDHYYGDELQAREEEEQEEEDAHIPGTLPTLRTNNIKFNKEAHLNEDLPARISRIWYINPYGQEILPPANPRAVQALSNAQAIIYSIGSLYTSLVPNLVLRGMGDALRRNTRIGSSGLRTKILILNGCLDREVGPPPPSSGARASVFSAVDFVEAIIRAGEQSRGIAWNSDSPPDTDTPEKAATDTLPTLDGSNTATTPSKSRPGLLSSKSESVLRTTLKSSSNGARDTNQRQQQLFPPPLLASSAASREPSPSSTPPSPAFDHGAAPRSNSTLDALARLPPSLQSSRPVTPVSSSRPNPIYTSYVTHLIHLPNSASTPYVDKELLSSKYGIQCVRVYGRSAGDGEGMRYDPAALRGAIEAILGRRAEREVSKNRHAHAHTTDEVVGSGSADTRHDEAKWVQKGQTVAEGEWSWRAREMARRNTLDG